MQVLSTPHDLEAACKRLAEQDFITVDTEFLREQTFWPKLCLIQVASRDEELIIDPLAEGMDLGPFWKLMLDTSVMKVFHAARQDIEIVFEACGAVPSPVFDTQVAAMVCGFGDSISYVNLVKRITNQTLDKSSRFTDWSRRPLTKKQLDYAIGDVTHLRDVYLHLKSELDANDRARWLDEEMATLTAPETYISEPDDAWKRMKMKVKSRKSMAVLMSLAAWRERIAKEQNVPRGRVMKDDTLFDIANQMPTSVEQLSSLRSLSDGFSRSSKAREIVEAVKEGLERLEDRPDEIPSIKAGKPLTTEQLAAVELLKVLLKAAAARHGVAARLIADAKDLETIARDEESDVAALKGWRRELFGEDAERLKRGELALMIRGGDVRAVKVKGTAKAE